MCFLLYHSNHLQKKSSCLDNSRTHHALAGKFGVNVRCGHGGRGLGLTQFAFPAATKVPAALVGTPICLLN